MSELLTFAEAKSSYELKTVAGVCSDSDQFMSYLNQGTRRLMTRGNFWGTVQRFAGCVYDDCIVWPRYVGTPLALNFCKGSIAMQNNWFRFMPLEQIGKCSGGTGWDAGQGRCWGQAVGMDDSQVCVFKNVPCGQNYYVRAYPMTRNDIGKTITFFGTDYNGQPIRSLVNGVYQDGVTLTLALPFVSTPMLVRRIDRVLKDQTEMPLNVFTYDPVANILYPCATYAPTETAPAYRKTTLKGVGAGVGSCSGTRQIDALVKLQFIPVQSDTDLVLISNLDALKMMIQSIRHGEAGDKAEADSYEASAIHELNLEVRDKFPVEQIPININAFGTALPSYHGVGRIV